MHHKSMLPLDRLFDATATATYDESGQPFAYTVASGDNCVSTRFPELR